MATRGDGSVGALHSKVLRDWKMAAGATYHAALAAELQAIGFGVDRIGHNGTFEIEGVEEDAIRYFSARRNEIEAELEAAGTTSGEAAALAAAVTKSTRSAKDGNGDRSRHETWREAAARIGLDIESFARNLPGADREIEPGRAELALADRLAVLPRQLTEYESVVERRELMRSVTASLVGTGLPVARAERETERMLSEGMVMEIGSDPIGLPRYSTPEMIGIERDIVRFAGELAERKWHKADRAAITEQRIGPTLNAEQQEAVLAATGPSAVTIVEGAPGSGKTTMLAPVVEAYRSTGMRVVGAATAWRVANALRDELRIEARATASWMERLRLGKPFLDRDSVLVVDEAGLLSSREMHALLAEVHRVEAKIILVGDRRQLQAIGAGPGLDLVARAIEATRVDTIVRQHEQWARDAVVAFGRGDAAGGLAAFAGQGMLVETDTYRAALDRIVTQRREWTKAGLTDEQCLIVARTNAQVAAISRAVRADLKQTGHLNGPELSLETVTSSGHSTQIELAAGDRIRFLARNDELGVVNGTVGTVTKVIGRGLADDAAVATGSAQAEGRNRNGAVSIEALVDGRRIVFSPQDVADEQDRARLGWAYASTVYGAQGMTVDRTAVLLDPAFDRHAIHVAASRAREETILVLDRSAIDRHLAADRPLDRQDEPVVATDAERQKWLAERLSRAVVKMSTMDVVESLSRPHDRRWSVDDANRHQRGVHSPELQW
jgi:nucleoside-triphosphatase THEP1